MKTMREWEADAEERRLAAVREHEIQRGQLVIGGPATWYASLRYSGQVWDVLKDRRWRREQAATL